MDKDAVNNALNKLDFLMGSNITINGYNIQLLGINFMDYTLPWVSKRHYHDFYELHYVMDGECHTYLGEIEHHVKPRQYYIIQQGIMHSHKSQWHLGFCIRWRIGKSNEYSAKDAGFKVMNYIQQLDTVCNQTAYDTDSRFFNRLIEISRNSETCSSLVCQLEFIHFLFSLPMMMAFTDPEILEMPLTETNNEVVETCIRYINDHCLSDIKVADIADHVHLSYGYVSRLFKKNVGHTINYEIMLSRLHKSQHYLLSTNDSVESIARKTGFSTVGYYSQSFSKHMHCTPTEYRKAHRRLDE